MHKTKKRILSAIMVLAMLFSMLPATGSASAAEPVQKAFAIGSTSYGTLVDVANAAKNGDTITLQRNFEASSLATFKTSVTLDLNGHTLTMAKNLKLDSAGDTLTITDSSAAGTGSINFNGNYAVNVIKGSKIVFAGGTYHITKNDLTGAGTLSVESGAFNKDMSKYVTTGYYKVIAGTTRSYYPTWEAAYTAYENSTVADKAIGDKDAQTAAAVTFDDGNGNTSTLNLYAPSTIKVPEAATREGYAFAGWKAGSSDTVYAPGDEVTITAATAYAGQWNGNASKLTYKDFDANGETKTATVANGDTVTLSGTDGKDTSFTVQGGVNLTQTYQAQETKEGATFLGWDYTRKGANGHLFTARFAQKTTINAVYGEGTTLTEAAGVTVQPKSGQYVDVTGSTSGKITFTVKKDLAASGSPYTETVVLYDAQGNFAAAYDLTINVAQSGTTPTFANNRLTVAVGEKVDMPALKNVPEGAKVTYKSADRSIAQATDSNTKVKGNKAGTTKIIATIGATANTKASKAVLNVTVSANTYTVKFDGNGMTAGSLPGEKDAVTAGSKLDDPQS